MKQSLANLDHTNKHALREAENIMQQIGQASHVAGHKAIKATEPKKVRVEPQRRITVY